MILRFLGNLTSLMRWKRSRFKLKQSLMELSKGEYASTIMMSTKKYIFDNWMKRHMCEDYHVQTNMPCPYSKEIFDTLEWTKVFSTMDLQSKYH